MKVIDIAFKNYRNLKEDKINLHDGVNIIFGDNAQGKTNLIEAIWIFTGGRSFRGSKDSELICFNKDNAQVNMNFYASKREQNACININKKKREIFLNKVKKNSSSSFVGEFCAVVFSPVHLSIVKEGPVLRRKFLDAAICQIKPSYCLTVLNYNRILLQRNTLLKNINYSHELLDTLDIWDERLSKYSALILKQRIKYCNLLKVMAKDIYNDISCKKENLLIFYKSSLDLYDDAFENNIENKILDKLKNSRKEDLKMGFTTLGPHRDDLKFKIDDKSIKSFASQGQQRSCVLSLKLAEANILNDSINQKPVVLLDDVMSELDSFRKSYFLNSLKNWQVFITCCEDLNIGKTENINKIKVNSGSFS